MTQHLFNQFSTINGALYPKDTFTKYHLAYAVQSWWQVHSGKLVGLSRPPLVSSTSGHQPSAPGPLPVTTQLLCLGESLEKLSWPWVGCIQAPELGPGWIPLFSPVGRGSWWCLQGCLYLYVPTMLQQWVLLAITYLHEGAEVEKCVTYQAFQLVLNLMKGPIEHHLIKRYEVSLWDTFLLIHANLPQVMWSWRTTVCHI